MGAVVAGSGANVDRGGGTTSSSEGAGTRDKMFRGRCYVVVKLCRCQWVCEAAPRDQTEEAVQDSLLSWMSCMFLER